MIALAVVGGLCALAVVVLLSLLFSRRQAERKVAQATNSPYFITVPAPGNKRGSGGSLPVFRVSKESELGRPDAAMLAREKRPWMEADAISLDISCRGSTTEEQLALYRSPPSDALEDAPDSRYNEHQYAAAVEHQASLLRAASTRSQRRTSRRTSVGSTYSQQTGTWVTIAGQNPEDVIQRMLERQGASPAFPPGLDGAADTGRTTPPLRLRTESPHLTASAASMGPRTGDSTRLSQFEMVTPPAAATRGASPPMIGRLASLPAIALHDPEGVVQPIVPKRVPRPRLRIDTGGPAPMLPARSAARAAPVAKAAAKPVAKVERPVKVAPKTTDDLRRGLLRRSLLEQPHRKASSF
jgi:hypothetical protein